MKKTLLLTSAALFLTLALAGQATVPPLFLDTTSEDIYAITDETCALALGDIDGDGDLDLVVGNGFNQPIHNKILVNTGKGWLWDHTSMLLPINQARTRAVALGDLDGDGDLDLVFGNRNSQNQLYLNKGDGSFTLTTTVLPQRQDATVDLELIDVDGDGDLDLLVINDLAQNYLLLNDGKGNFTDVTSTSLPAASDAAWDCAAGDLDGDKDIDFIVCKWGPGQDGQNRLYLNDGKGKFTDATQTGLPAVSDRTFSVTLADLDGDLDLDLVLGNDGDNKVLRNDGKGTFTAAPAGTLPLDPQITGEIGAADFDGDGDLDLVVANINASAGLNRLYLNDGTGKFTDASNGGLPMALDGSLCLAVGDLDHDGDKDLIIGNVGGKGQQNRLYRNLTREIHSPRPFLLGKLYQLDVYTRPDQGNPLLIVVPFLAGRESHMVIPPYGVFGLDLTTLVALDPLLASPLTKKATYSFHVPLWPDMLGMRVYFQAVVENQINFNKDLRFTNSITDVLAKP